MRASAPALPRTRFRGESSPDERLVARARAGDARAFEEIYDRYSRPIHSFCRHLLGQADDAEDAVQHTFLSAYRGIQLSAQPIDLRPWLFAIARNRCVSVLRPRRRDVYVVGGDAPESATEGLLAAAERRESLRDAPAPGNAGGNGNGNAGGSGNAGGGGNGNAGGNGSGNAGGNGGGSGHGH